jgi:hypothetical protein
MLRSLWLHKIQWAFFCSFLFVNLFLPFVFSPDTIVLYLTLSILLGRAMQCSEEMHAGFVVDDVVLSNPSERPIFSSKTAFQPTIFGSQ